MTVPTSVPITKEPYTAETVFNEKEHQMTDMAEDFLEAALWIAADPEDMTEPFKGKTVHDFAPEIVEGVERFCEGFRAHLEASGFDMGLLKKLERSFGSNCYFSLSGHGVGFFDESDATLAGLQERLRDWSRAPYRFEEFAGLLEVREDGKIDIAIIPEAIAKYRAEFFDIGDPLHIRPLWMIADGDERAAEENRRAEERHAAKSE